MKRITSVLLIFVMLFSVVSLTGCTEQYALEKGEFGYDYFSPISGTKLGIRSKENTFVRDNVNLDIYLGLKQVQHPVKKIFTNLTADPSRVPIISEEDKNRYYVLGAWAASDFISYPDHSCFVTTKNLYVFQEISHIDMMMSEKYDYYVSGFSNLQYNYCKSFTIPEDMIEKEINKDDGEYSQIFIGILNICKNENGEYDDIGCVGPLYVIYVYENEDGSIILR